MSKFYVFAKQILTFGHLCHILNREKEFTMKTKTFCTALIIALIIGFILYFAKASEGCGGMTTVNPPPLTLDDPVSPPSFDEEDPVELGDGECIL